MAFSSGTFSLDAANPTTGTTISSTWAATVLNGITTGLSTCILKDGTQTCTAAIPFITGVTTTSTTFAVFNTTATTVNAFGAASTALNIGHASGTNTVSGATTFSQAITASGAITASSTINKVTVTAPATSATLTISDGGSLITSGGHSLTLTTTGATDVTLPTTGTLIVGSDKITLGTPVASTSGTSIDFTGLPAGVKRITVSLRGVSTNGTSALLIQLGDSGGVETTGYVSTSNDVSASANSTAGLMITRAMVASGTYSGSAIITLENSTLSWVMIANIGKNEATANAYWSSGDKSLSGTLDRVRITTVNGTDAFDLGEINIAYE